MSILIKVIGCGDAFSSGGQNHTCFYLESDHKKILLDCGASSLSALKAQQIPVEEIDAVLISHLHGDHYGGVPFLLLDMLRKTRKKKLTLIGPPEMEERTWQLFRLLYPGSDKELDSSLLVFKTFRSSELLEEDGFSIEAFPVVHTPQTHPHALRIKFNDKTIAFSGDTGWTEQLIPLARETDLFICECNFFDQQTSGHLCYQEIRTHLPVLKTKRIVLTHLGTQMLARKDEIELEYLKQGQVIII